VVAPGGRSCVRVALMAMLAAAPLVAVPHAGAFALAAGTIHFDATLAQPLSATPCNGVYWKAALPAPAAPGKAYFDVSAGGFGCSSTAFDFVSPGSFTILGNLTLDLYIGCDVGGVAGPGQNFTGLPFVDGVQSQSWDASLYYDGTQVDALHYGYDKILCTGAGNVTHVTYAFPLAALSIEEGKLLEVQVDLYTEAVNPPAQSGQVNFYVATGNPAAVSGLSAIGIPTPAQVAGTVRTYSNLQGPSVGLDETWGAPRTSVQTYNWTTNATTVVTSYAAATTNGSVAFSIKDGSGAVVQSGVLSGGENRTQSVGPVQPGRWQLVLSYSGFVGHMHLGISPPDPGTSPGPPSSTSKSPGAASPTPGSSSAPSNPQSAARTTPTTKTSPSLALPSGLVAAAIAVAIAVALLRRRRNRADS
jgi:hypothetical protein